MGSGSINTQSARGTIGQSVLHGIGLRWHDITHQPFQLHFTERPARALVAQQFLQADDVGGQAVYFFLSLIYGSQPRHHADESFIGFLEAFVEPLVHLAADLLQSPVHRLGQGFDATRQMLGRITKGILNELLVFAPLLSQLRQRLRQYLVP